MTTTTTITPIPHLAPGQSVKDWRRRFLAATATLKDEEKMAMLPAYVHRTNGEVLIAEVCAGKTTLEEALKELENLIDGEKNKMIRVNEFWIIKPDSLSYTDLMSFFFTLTYEGKLAGVSFEMIMIKFLNALTKGEEIYNSNKDKIKEGMTEVTLLEVFQTIKTKIRKASKDVKSSHVIVKKEPLEEMGIFVANSENVPSWANELRNEVHDLKGALQDVQFYQENMANDSQIMLNSSVNGSANYSKNPLPNKRKCWICDKPGHFANSCQQRKCSKCGKPGHIESQCYSKRNFNFQNRSNFPSSNNL